MDSNTWKFQTLVHSIHRQPNNNSKDKKIKWTREEFKEVIPAFYQAFNEPRNKTTKGEGKLVNIECILMPKNSLMLGEILCRRTG